MSFEIPLFPLSVVLFPGMQLPLHIFEPRYRLMAERALAGDSTFGVALLVEGHEGQPDTVPAEVGCSTEITEATRLPDGRINLMTVGRRRFRVLSTRRQDGYLIGSCEWLDDQHAQAQRTQAEGAQAEGLQREPATALARRVRMLLGTYLASLARNANLSPRDLDALDVPRDPLQLSMWVASIITLPNEQKQKLLELSSTQARLQAEQEFLLRGEIVQKAYARRGRQPQDEGDEDGPFARFVSIN